MFRRRSPSLGTDRIDTLLGKTARIQGDLLFAGGLHLDGRIEGSARAEPGSESTLSVSESGQIDGSVEVPHVLLEGSVRGDIVATGRVVLGARARVEGSVVYGTIEMAAGASVQGKLVPHVDGRRGPPQGLYDAAGTAMAAAGTK
ncbi:MAG: polymer-forming cytoskeletal protein [Steroidobacteraceae bacterium]